MRQFVTEIETARDFIGLINDGHPSLVAFYAEWCRPCGKMAPIVRRCAREFNGRLTFARVNIDDHPEIALGNDANRIPLLLTFAGGRPLGRLEGLQHEQRVRGFLEAHALARPDPARMVPLEPGLKGALKRLFAA